MFIHRDTVKTYIFLFLCVYSIKITTSQRRHSRSRSTDESGQGSSYFFYQNPTYPRDCRDVYDRCSTLPDKSSRTYLIKPDGYLEPFEVYCDNEIDSGGWTIILRRSDGSLNFNRNWEDYKTGFGFLSSEHWLGNEKVSYLTNQAQCELRIDFVLYNGSTFYVNYNSFRITDEWSRYLLVSLGTYSGNASSAIFECPRNMVYKNLSCPLTCDDPSGSNTCSDPELVGVETCVCDDGFLKKGYDCVLPVECGCFVTETNSVIPNNGTYVNSACSEKCICRNDQLICDSDYECSPNAACRVKENVRQCYCNEGYKGDGETCTPLYKDCYDAYEANQKQNGVYTILPRGWPGSPFNVYCDMTTSGGGWTVFQRRVDRVTDFHRNWSSYRNGFGSVQHGRDFWLGNEQLYYLTNTNQRSYKLRVDFETSGGSYKFGEYASFRTDSEDTKYSLVELGSYSGNAGNGMDYASGKKFSTYDDDNDDCGNHNCAQRHRGAWWYASNWCSYCYGTFCDNFRYSSSCTTYCTYSNLNGKYNGGNGENILWHLAYNCNLTSAEMKIRPII